MSAEYRDSRIECAADEMVIHGYYFPWGSKRIRYEEIRSIRRVTMGALNGRGRIWGTANPRVWANLDVRRPGKRIGFLLNLGRSVQPLVTPDDPNAAEACLRAHAGPGVFSEVSGRAPIV